MNSTSSTAEKEPMVLADCANFGHVIGNKTISQVAVEYSPTLIEKKPHDNGYRIRSLEVWDINSERGSGCDHCLEQGRLAVYKGGDPLSKYYELKTCPYCFGSETE